MGTDHTSPRTTMAYEYPAYIATECAHGLTCVGPAGRIGLWIAFGCMFLPFLWFWMSAQKKPVGQRKFEYLSMTINGIASLAYLTMAFGYGATSVNGQEFFFARYVDWTLTTPLMLLDLILLGHGAKAQVETICHVLAIDALMIIGGLIGALQGAWLTAIFWCGYPIAWVLHEGTSIISLDTAVIIYLILDTISKSVWGIMITMGRDSVADPHVEVALVANEKGAGTAGGSTASPV